MAEGFTCDRCGAVHPGSPHGTIAVGDGLPRSRPTEERGFPTDQGIISEDISDVCNACLDAFEEWWDDG